MITENEVRNALIDFVDAQDLDRLEDWLAQKSWNMHLDSEPSAQRLIGKAQIAIAEYDLDHISAAQLRQILAGLADDYSVSLVVDATPRPVPIFSSGSPTVQIRQLQAVSV